jgi:hypothetical protein
MHPPPLLPRGASRTVTATGPPSVRPPRKNAGFGTSADRPSTHRTCRDTPAAVTEGWSFGRVEHVLEFETGQKDTASVCVWVGGIASSSSSSRPHAGRGSILIGIWFCAYQHVILLPSRSIFQFLYACLPEEFSIISLCFILPPHIHQDRRVRYRY